MAQREPREVNDAFLAFVRRRRCCACDAPPPVQAAHIRMGSPENTKRSTGMGEKPHDRWCTPLCQSCHLDGPGAQHKVGEARFWQRAGIDPFAIAMKLFATFQEAGVPSDLGTKPRPQKRKGVKPIKRRVDSAPKSKAWPSRPMQSVSRWPTGRKFGQ